MGKECGAWVSRRLWGGGNTSPLKTTAYEAKYKSEAYQMCGSRKYPSPTMGGIGNSRGMGGGGEGSMAQEILEGKRGEWLD